MTREKAIEIIKYHKILVDNDKSGLLDKDLEYEAINKAIKALEQEPNTWSLDDAREDFMSDVYNTLDFLPTNDEADRIIDSFDMVTSGIKQEPCEDTVSRSDVMALIERTNLKYLSSFRRGISQKAFEDLLYETITLPSVTPQPKTGHWIFKQFDEETGVSNNYWCSECGKPLAQVYKKYCSNCGARMAESEE